MPSLNTKLASAPNTSSNYVLKATTSTTIGNSLIFDNGTQVGIGTNSINSGATLEVYNATQGNLFISSSSTNDSCLRFYSGGNELVTLRSTGTGALRIETGTGSPAERLRITNTGNVGINTATPLALLDVCVLTGGARRLLVNYADSIVTVKSSNDSSNGENLRLVGDNIIFNSGSSGNGSERMRITSAGDVGIGSTGSSSYKLQLSKTLSSATSLFCLDNATNSTNDFGMDFTVLGYLRVGAIRMAYPADNNLSMAFYTYNGAGNVTERMRINNSGNLLVGKTATGISTLGCEILGNGTAVFAFAVNNNEAIIFNNTNTGTTYELDFRTNAVERGKISVTDSGVSYITTPSDLNLKKNFEVWDESVLDMFKNLNPQKFNFIVDEDGQPKTKGFIAQELVDYFPEAYPKSKERYFFNPSGMVVYLMKAVQELTKEIEELKQLVK